MSLLNEESLGSGLLFGKKKELEDICLGSKMYQIVPRILRMMCDLDCVTPPCSIWAVDVELLHYIK